MDLVFKYKFLRRITLLVVLPCLWLSLTGQEIDTQKNVWISVGNDEVLCSYDSFNNVLGCPYREGILIAGSNNQGAVLFYWNGIIWSELSRLTFSTFGELYDIAVYNEDIYLAGTFTDCQELTGVNGLIRWNGSIWENPGGCTEPAFAACVNKLEVFDSCLYAGGYFTQISGVSANNIAYYNGNSWSSPGSGTDNAVYGMYSTDSCLYVGGSFINAGGITVNNIACWDGNWHSLGSGMLTEYGGITQICGNKDTLFAYGPRLQQAGGVNITHMVALWDGSHWGNAEILHNVPDPWTKTIFNYDGKVWFAGNYYMGWNESFLQWNGSGLDTITGSGLGEYVITDVVVRADQMYVLGILSWGEPTYVKKWCQDGNCLFIRGRVYNDVDNDCYFNEMIDRPLKNQVIKIQPGNKLISTNPKGVYSTLLETDRTYTLSFSARDYWLRTCMAESYVVDSEDGNIITGLDFPLSIDPSARDVSVEITGLGGIPSAHGLINNVLVKNPGSVPVVNGVLKVTHDGITEILDHFCRPDPDNIIHDTLVYYIGNLPPGSEMNFRIYFRVPPPGPTGEKTTWTALINPGFEDYVIDNNRDTLSQVILNAYDPNDKGVSPPGETEYGYISREDSILHYTIRFQNTGTYYASNVFLFDTIASELDIETIDITGTSHSMYMEYLDERAVVFRFDNIFLPDSNINEPESHGLFHTGLMFRRIWITDGTQ
jgi:hypothetical protein